MFYADLHVHSKYSRATSRDCDLEHLALWAGKKGISLVATGDFTHPGWSDELHEKLVPAEPGLFRLRPNLEAEVGRQAGAPPGGDIRFLLEVEISTIYKKDGRTRKVHHLVYVPGLDEARRFSQSLARIGNIGSDGRPILGLDSRNLLEITLQSGDGCYLIPAHIWTPWFAVLGSKSGFDSIEHCYADLAPEIFALETGLSSDPAMNWRLSSLDRYRLVSNSDAHSPGKLGREACVFDSERDYYAIRRALRTGDGYRGTVEFFPEEGKYHLDGHRKCGVCLEPDATRRCGGICPTCGKPLTLGVMYRVEELADRPEGEDRPPQAAPFRSLIPLEEVLSEIQGVGPQSNAVRQKYDELLNRVGPELFILEQAPPEDIARAGSPLLAEALRRMRCGQVIRQGGYDGQYGTIRLFTRDELLRRSSAGVLFDLGEEQQEEETGSLQVPLSLRERAGVRGAADPSRTGNPPSPPVQQTFPDHILDRLDPEQRAAAEAIAGPVLIIAGPGTGKTRTLTHRLAHLVADHDVAPEQCLALTFSRRATREMLQRLQSLLPAQAARVPVMTFHALGLSILRQQAERLGLSASLRVAAPAERSTMLQQRLAISQRAAEQLLGRISQRKRRLPEESLTDGADDQEFAAYQRELRARGWLDFDDLIAMPLELLQAHPELVEDYRSRYRWISVDEYQDIDSAQYALVRLLVPPDGNLCAIGDPDQAIYGFRGADVGYFQRFQRDFPTARAISLRRNYRSTQTIVDAALQLIAPASLVADRQLLASGLGPEQIEIHTCATDRAEAELVVHTIEQMIGGATFFSFDSQRVAGHDGDSFSFADFAVLYRTEVQADVLAEALERSGMPFQRRSHDRLADRPWVQAVIEAMTTSATGSEPSGSVLELLDAAAGRVRNSGVDASEDESALAALRDLAARHENDLPQFLSELALGVDADLWDPRADRVSLLTLHAAKGLEFPVVFIVGCEDGVLPLHWGTPDQEALAEERRLFFVGMTRAQQHLILTHARKRRWQGKLREMSCSPFLADIQQQLLAYHQHRATKKPPAPDRQRSLFDT